MLLLLSEGPSYWISWDGGFAAAAAAAAVVVAAASSSSFFFLSLIAFVSSSMCDWKILSWSCVALPVATSFIRAFSSGSDEARLASMLMTGSGEAFLSSCRCCCCWWCAAGDNGVCDGGGAGEGVFIF